MNAIYFFNADRLLLAETVSALQAFRKRHGEAQRIHAQYASQPTTVDLDHYRAILKNKAVVDDVAKALAEYKPVTYDVAAHIKAIETFEATAVAKAKETVEKVDVELKDLQATLANIEDARPFEDLTVCPPCSASVANTNEISSRLRMSVQHTLVFWRLLRP